MLNGRWRGQEIGSCSDCWHYHEELRAGRITEAEWVEIENAMSRSNGHCMTMGTASTMACVTEALGLTLPGGAAIPAVDSRRRHLAEAAGRQIVELVEADLRPSRHPHARGLRERDPRAACDLAARRTRSSTCIALRRAGSASTLPLAAASTSSRASTPWLVDLKPAGPIPDGGLLLRRRRAGRHGADRPICCISTRSRSPVGRSARTSPAREIINTEVIRTARRAARRRRRARRAARQPVPGRRGDEDHRRRSAAAPARGPGDRVRGHPRPRRPRRRPRRSSATRRA